MPQIREFRSPFSKALSQIIPNVIPQQYIPPPTPQQNIVPQQAQVGGGLYISGGKSKTLPPELPMAGGGLNKPVWFGGGPQPNPNPAVISTSPRQNQITNPYLAQLMNQVSSAYGQGWVPQDFFRLLATVYPGLGLMEAQDYLNANPNAVINPWTLQATQAVSPFAAMLGKTIQAERGPNWPYAPYYKGGLPQTSTNWMEWPQPGIMTPGMAAYNTAGLPGSGQQGGGQQGGGQLGQYTQTPLAPGSIPGSSSVGTTTPISPFAFNPDLMRSWLNRPAYKPTPLSGQLSYGGG